MVERVEAIAKPELLAWAHKSAGLDLHLAAKRIGSTEERLLSSRMASAVLQSLN